MPSEADSIQAFHAFYPESNPNSLLAVCVGINKLEADPYCGNGVLDDGEECDDGNNVDGDGCSSICKIETPSSFCGNGILEFGEQCDWGVLNGFFCWAKYGSSCNYCTSTCELKTLTNYCGDGIKQACEECDLGELNGVLGSGCTINCKIEIEEPEEPYCGDGTCNGNETCETCPQDCGICEEPEEPEEPACPFEEREGRTIIDFSNERIWSQTGSEFPHSTGNYSVFLVKGKYNVSIYAWDGYEERINISQPYESYKIIFYDKFNNKIAESGSNPDLEDYVAFADFSGIVSTNLVLSSNIAKIEGLHSAYPDNSNPNSVNAGCVAFDLIKDPEEPEKPKIIKLSHGNIVEFNECVPNWKCSGWSECLNSVMTRTCEDVNFCDYAYNKPLESSLCVMSSVKIENEKISSNLWVLIGGIILLIILLFILVNLLR